MSFEDISKAIATLGFPIVVAAVVGWVLNKIGFILLDRYTKTLDINNQEMREQTKVLNDIKAALPSICRAGRASDHQNEPRENFEVRSPGYKARDT